MTVQQLKNAIYRTDGWGDRIQLHDGASDTADTRVSLTKDVAFGDIDADGVDDAAAIIEVSDHGTGIWRQLAVVLSRDGRPVNVATADLGDRVQIDWMRIVGGRVLVDMVDHGPDDPVCCPTLKVRRTYMFSAGRIALLSTAPLEQAAAPALTAAPRPAPAAVADVPRRAASAPPATTPAAPPAAASQPVLDSAPTPAPEEPVPPVTAAPPPAAPAPAITSDISSELVSGGADPVVRFPVAHSHFMSVCYGYLYFSRNAIWYEPEAPAKDKDHAFHESRADLKVARQWIAAMKTPIPAVELRFRDATYHFFRVSRSTVRAAPPKPGSDVILAYDDVLDAANRFDRAVAAASRSRATADCSTPASQWQEVNRDITADRGRLERLGVAVDVVTRGGAVPDEHVRDEVRDAASGLRGAGATLDDLIASGSTERQRAVHVSWQALSELLRQARVSGNAPADLPGRLSDYQSALNGLIAEALGGPLAAVRARAAQADGSADMLMAAIDLRTNASRDLANRGSHAQSRLDLARTIVREMDPAAAQSNCAGGPGDIP